MLLFRFVGVSPFALQLSWRSGKKCSPPLFLKIHIVSLWIRVVAQCSFYEGCRFQVEHVATSPARASLIQTTESRMKYIFA